MRAAPSRPGYPPYVVGFCLLLSVLPLQTLCAAPHIVSNGQACADIVIAETPARMTQLAAEELQTYIAKITGATLSITTAPDATLATHIYVGTNGYTDALGLTVTNLDHGAFRMTSGSDWLALIGQDSDFTPPEPHNTSYNDLNNRVTAEWDVLTGETWQFPHSTLYKRISNDDDIDPDIWEHDERGSLNAVYHFLRTKGVRWYLPCAFGEIVPATNTIPLPDVDTTVHPDFAVRYPYQTYRLFRQGNLGATYDEIMWQLRLGLNNAADVVGLSGLGHGINAVHAREEVKFAHPEYYALYDGERYTNSLGKPCLSSRGLFTQNVQYVRFMFDHYDAPMVSVMPADGYTRACECELCAGKTSSERHYNGSISDYVWDYVNRVAAEVYKTHPDKKIVCFAYGAYRFAPTNIPVLSSNVVVGICQHRNEFDDAEYHQQFLDLRDDWLALMPSPDKQLLIWEYYLFHQDGRSQEFLPAFIPHRIASDVASLKDISMGEFIEVYRNLGVSTQRLAMTHLNLYVNARMWWDADQDVDVLLDEYYTNFYGAASHEMKDFVDYCEDNWMFLSDKPDRIEHVFDLLGAAEAKVTPGSDEDDRIALIADYIAPLTNWPVQLPTNIYWCGRGDGSNWTDVANWTNAGAWWTAGARYPSTTNDVAYLSDDCTDEAQTIVVDDNITVREVRMDATGNRTYTVDDNGTGYRLTVDRPYDAEADYPDVQFTLASYAEQPLTLNCDMVRGTAYQRLGYDNQNTNHAIVVNGDRYYAGPIEDQPWFCARGRGPIILRGAIADGPWHYNYTQFEHTGDLILANPNAIDANFTHMADTWNTAPGCTWSVAETDSGDALGKVELKRQSSCTWNLRINEAGSTDRTLTARYLRHWPRDEGRADCELRFVPNAGGSSGDLTLRLTWEQDNSMPVDFRDQDGARLLFDGSIDPGDATYTQELEHRPVYIRGPGSVWVANDRALELHIETEYTGGTVLTNNGTILLNTNTAFVGVSGHGQLPDTGSLLITSNSLFDLNSYDDTIGSLRGDGAVNLGGANLTISEGVQPGVGLGRLTIHESGSVTLGGTSTFEFMSASSFDRLVLTNDASLALGGTLEIDVPPTFTTSDYGNYTIVALEGGAVNDSFDVIQHNLPTGTLQVATVGNDVVLSFGHSIEASTGFGGSIAPSGTLCIATGSDRSFTNTAIEGYYIDDILVDGVSVGAFGPGVIAYTNHFTSVDRDHTIETTFAALEQHTVTFIEGVNGTISGSKLQTVDHATDCTPVTAVPNSGFAFDQWSGDYVGTENPLTVTGVTEDMTITATFRSGVGSLFKFR